MNGTNNVQFPMLPAQFKKNLAALMEGAGDPEHAEIVSSSDIEVVLGEHDNWNGGTDYWSVVVRVAMETFTVLTPERRALLQEAVMTHGRLLLEPFNNDGIAEVLIAPHLLPAEATPDNNYDAIHGFASREHFYSARELEYVRDLGSGAYGEVVLVKRRHLGTHLAVKFFSPSPFVARPTVPERWEKARQRVLREGRLLAGLRHTNVVQLMDSSLVAGSPVLVLEYVNGESLTKIRDRRGLWSYAEANSLLTQVLMALAECHRREIVHRDVSPNNVVVDDRDRAVLIDFGLGFSAEMLGDVRQTSQTPGTPGYIAPELIGNPLLTEPTVDVYSVGALGVFLLTGHVHQMGRPIHAEGAPPLLLRALEQALNFDSSKRFPNAEKMLEAISQVEVTCNQRSVARLVSENSFTEQDLREFLGIGEKAN